ncbi:MAG: DUF2478 domain-containing protein [Pseudorhodobacter sp.]|nr:DUF2478 domain-containing protein [Pseudorhodobacter sp.]
MRAPDPRNQQQKDIKTMRIAYTIAPGRGDVDRVLKCFADHLAHRGLRTCGVVQINTERDYASKCDMDVQVLPAGPIIRISEYRGRGARGCRLDPVALEQAVMEVSRRMEAEVDVLIVNKFGKHEAEGRGFRNIIAEALLRDIPVIVGASALNLEAFNSFFAGLATPIAPSVAALVRWFETSHCDCVGMA